MPISTRQFISPLAAVLTMIVGLVVVAAADAVAMLFQDRVPPAQTTVAKPSNAAPPIATQDFFATPPRAEEPVRKELSCYDMNILPIWHELKKDDEFNDRVGYSSDSPNCSDMLEIKRVDLNRDGNKEFLVRGKNFHLCGATGNCGFWIFEKRGSRFKKLLSSSDYVDISELGEQVLKSKTSGYADILLRGHFSVSETGFYTYKFNGRKYVESRCMYEVPKYTRQGKALAEMITCKEFDRRNGF